MTVIAVALGAAVGAPCRYLLDRLVQGAIARRSDRRRDGRSPVFPWGLLVVNLLGSLVLGVVSGFAGRRHVPDAVVLGLATGWCGAFTTYSSFGYDTVQLARRRRRLMTAANVLITVLGGLAAVALGVWLGVGLGT